MSIMSLAAMGAVSLYQLGVIRHLPDPSIGLLDSDAVDASGEAYANFDMPDAPLGALSYAATLVLASMGGESRATTRPVLPLLMAGKALLDAAGGVWITAEQAAVHRRFCGLCVTASAASVIAAAYALPEARDALRSRGRSTAS